MRNLRYVATIVLVATALSGWHAFPGKCLKGSEPPRQEGRSRPEAQNQRQPHNPPEIQQAKKAGIDKLGVLEGDPIATGFVFWDGSCVSAPYRVSRVGRCVKINGQTVRMWEVWPLPDLRVDEDPGLPEGLDAKSTFEDLDGAACFLDRHPSRKYRYLYQHFPPDVAARKMMEYYRQLPFVAEADLKLGAVLQVKTKAGYTRNIILAAPVPGEPYSWETTPQHVVERLESERRQIERRLKQGQCLFLFSNKAELWMPRQRAARDLGLVVSILQSDRTYDEKVSLLHRMEVLPPRSLHNLEQYSALIRQFKASPGLEERIRDLVAETGVTPRSLVDVPDENPFERRLRLEQSASEADR